MIIGNITCGLLIQYCALKNTHRSKSRDYPSWCTIIGATLNDIIAGVFLLIGIENIRSNSNFKPLGLDVIYIDLTHSFLMITIWSIIWAMYCHVTVNRTNRDNQVWLYSFIAVMTHLLTDHIVHQPDIAPYLNANTKYGLSLWRSIPIISWIDELLLILVAIGPGPFTNIPYTLGKMFQNHHLLLRLSVGIAFIGTYIFYLVYLLVSISI